MARPREFDADGVIDGVMRAFWTKGYEATSVDDLCVATNLSKSSLYSAFGDKRELLAGALDRYIEFRIGHIREVLLGASSIKQGLAALTAQIIDDIVAGNGRRGCFIGNCAAEIGLTDRKIAHRVRAGLAAMEDALCERLVKARAQGEISEDFDMQAQARFLVASLQGLRLIGKVNRDREALQDIADCLMRSVR